MLLNNKAHTFTLLTTIAAAAPSFANGNGPTSQHDHHQHHKRGDSSSTTCQFPDHEGMVAVQKNGANAGWAMHYDQPCTPGTWCPYACKPGQLMAQWDSEITSYTYPGSQYGGLYCQDNGTLKTPFPEKDYCYPGKGTVTAVNNAGGGSVAFCQTVLPGNEEMLIPTLVESSEVLAVPGTEYWAGTSAHYYINPPGVSIEDGCKWGDSSNPWGNWSPYVTGANMDDKGNTYVTIGWNPIYLEQATPFRNEKPTFGIKITCDDESKCQNLPCGIDPAVNDVNEVTGSGTIGAGGAAFCVVTAKNYASAKVEVFDAGSSGITNTSEKMAKRDLTFGKNKTGHKSKLFDDGSLGEHATTKPIHGHRKDETHTTSITKTKTISI